jgi:tetratricopeptide (TPR) repeat protein
MNLRFAIAMLVTGAVVLSASAEAGRRSRQPATLAELSSRPAPVNTAEPVDADLALAAESYKSFLAIPDADPVLRSEALRRLADLRLAEAESLRAQDGADTTRADAATHEAIAAYEQLLAEQPSAEGSDAALYQLARAHEGVGESERAMARLDELVTKHPDGAHYAEAQFRRGETLFAAQRYADAESAYSAVLAASAAGEFGQQALYKLAWSQFKQSRDEDSSASFLRLLDGLLVSSGRLRPAAELSRAEQEFASDSMRALAITFAAGEGPVSLQAALDRHGPAAYESRLYRALGDLYVEKERYQDGAEAYRAFAKRRPMDPDAPLLLVDATEAYAKGGFQSLVLDGKRQLVEEYGPRSAFWQAQGANLDPRVSAAVRTSLLDLARHHHALAQQGGDARERDAAVRWYRDFLEGFDDAPEAPATRLLLADLLFEGSDFAAAAVEYERAAYSYPVNAESGRAGYAALVSYDRAEEQAPEAARATIRASAVDSSLRFADTFPERPEVPGVLTRTTGTLFDAGDRERASVVAKRVLALGPRADAGQQLVAWTVIAHTEFDAGHYAEAERAYAELVARLPAGDPKQAEAVERLAASVYRQAEAKQAAGDVTGAVSEFLRVASVAPTSPVRATAEFDAATLLVVAQRWDEAATVLQDFRRNHPGHELEAEATRKLAVAYLEGGRTREAAVELERVAASDAEEPELRRASLWQAAELYAQSGDVPAARRVYADYVARFPQPFAPAIEARHELANYAARSGDQTERRRWLEEIIAADAAAGGARTDRSRLLAAEASLEIARPLDEAARALKLSVPLDRSLLTKKKALESALAAYGRAVDYGVPAVTTESSYATAELYRHFGRALMDSERPGELSGEELEQYELLLEEQAFPFEEKSIGLHERNARRAAEGVYDDWVKRSYAALSELLPARYARTEILDGADVHPATPPELAAAFVMAQESLAAGRDEEARTMLEAALQRDPVNAVGWSRLGVAERRLGHFDRARDAYALAIGADPTYAAAERNLAVLLDLYLGDAKAALPHYERYQLLAGDSDTEASAWLVELRSRLGQVSRTADIKEPVE